MTRASGPVVRQDLPRLTSTATAVSWRCPERTQSARPDATPILSPYRARDTPTYSPRHGIALCNLLNVRPTFCSMPPRWPLLASRRRWWTASPPGGVLAGKKA